MENQSYVRRRDEIESYFDHTAADTWKRLTSDAPLGRIRQTVRAGRDEMRATLLGWMPDDLRGMRILDAGCGTGTFANEAASRGAHVVATDLSATLIDLARERSASLAPPGRIEFVVGDMLRAELGCFDYVVAMDSLIHYSAPDMVEALARLASKARRAVLFTYAPRTPLLALMHTIGRAFPRSDRAPAIEPISAIKIDELIEAKPGLSDWQICRTRKIANGFYTSQAMELLPT
jgi:magnesium-protoporphyrin O-methyltransferase